LIASVEGKRGEPEQKPPYPTDAGLDKRPTVINNVETLGNIPNILLNGADYFKQFGTEKSKGTKVFALAGDINNTGLVEVPLGMTLGEILFDIGGGIPKGKRFKVAQTGGPSGGCITGDHLNVAVDYESLADLGAIMGSGGLICMDEDTCMVDMARYFMEFVQDESCGKCLACRVGTRRMLEILNRITQGKGQEGDVELLIELSQTIKDTALCGLGQTAPNPVLSTIKYFREEYDQHIREHKCQAGVCGDLFISPCENACPAHVNVPGYMALIAAGRPLDAYRLIRQENPLPAVCGRICTHPCESKCRRSQLDEPLAISDLKRYAADEAMKLVDGVPESVLPKKDKSVGIVGAGPSGLTCGFYLAKMGYDVTIYEKHPLPGGVLAYGIPEYRLPREVLMKEIDSIKRVGVKIKTNVEIGQDRTFGQLREAHDAIFIGTGTHGSKSAGIPGEDLPGVHKGLEFLRHAAELKWTENEHVVAVIGGGSTAVDAARVSLRKGAKEVHIFYRRKKDDMPAHEREVDEAVEEGIVLHEMFSPVEILGTDKTNGVLFQKMKAKGYSSDGRNKVVADEGNTVVFPCDQVIVAVSQHTEIDFAKPYRFELTHWDTFIVDESTQRTNVEQVFAGGDVVRGSNVAILAIADGKRAASAIDEALGGTGELYKGDPIQIPMDIDDSELVEHARFPMDFLTPEERFNNFREVAYRYHRLNAMAEAMRCLRCDYRA
jgi:NADH-quinone oxidoreductase subunit F